MHEIGGTATREALLTLPEKGSMPDDRKKGGRQTVSRESDRLIVLKKAGNAAGGKEATSGRAG